MKKLKINKKMFPILLGGTMLMGTMVGCGEQSIDKQEVVTKVETKVFEPGEHILTDSIFWSSDHKRLEYHEGYEIIAVAQGDKLITIVYQNIVPVECVAVYSEDFLDESGKYEYIEFGTPVELEKTEEVTYKLN